MLIAAIIFVATSCSDDTIGSTIPFAPVNFTIDLDGFDNILKNPLSYKIFTEDDRRYNSDRFGYAGFFVVSDAAGAALYAYDLCCPYEGSREVKVVPDAEGRAICPQCGSIYITMYGSNFPNYGMIGLGSLEEGPGKEPLQSYPIRPIQRGLYHILN